MKNLCAILAAIVLSISAYCQESYYVYQGEDSVLVTLQEPLRSSLEVDLYHCYFWTDTLGQAFYDFDFSSNGVVDISDFLVLNATYGGQIQTPTVIDFLAAFGLPSTPIDAPDLNLFDFGYPGGGVYSSGFLATVPEEYADLLFENRVGVYPDSDDFIGQYTQSDELFPATSCPLEDWLLCMRTFKNYLFVLEPGSGDVYVESYYWIRLD